MLLYANGCRHPTGRFDLQGMTLAVLKTQGVGNKPIRLRDRERGGGVEAAADQDHGFSRGVHAGK
jgi:hypothetical protein